MSWLSKFNNFISPPSLLPDLDKANVYSSAYRTLAQELSQGQITMVIIKTDVLKLNFVFLRRRQTDKVTNARTARLDSVQHTAMFSY